MITVETPNNLSTFRVGETIKVFAYITPAPAAGTEVVFAIKRRRASAAKNTATDPSVVSITVPSDENGYAYAVWSISPAETVFCGDSFKYYPCVTSGTDTGTPATSDWTIYDRGSYLLAQLDTALGPIQAIPVYHEVAKESADNHTYYFTYNNWRDEYPPLIIDSATNTIVTPDSIDYQAGSITFTTAKAEYFSPQASYVFKFFGDFDLRAFASRTVSLLNMLPPTTGYTVESYPDFWEGLLIYGTVMNALDTLFISTAFQEKKVIFADTDVVAALSGYYQRLQTVFGEMSAKAKKRSMVQPSAISGHDVIAPPRVTAQNWQSYVFLQGRAL